MCPQDTNTTVLIQWGAVTVAGLWQCVMASWCRT